MKVRETILCGLPRIAVKGDEDGLPDCLVGVGEIADANSGAGIRAEVPQRR